MSADVSIKFDGVDGEMTEPKGEVQVLSWNWSIDQPSSVSGGGIGIGQAAPGNLNFTHLYDKSSPVFAKHCSAGKHFDSAKLTARKAGEGQQAFLVVTLKNVFITSCRPGGTQGGDIVENVSCVYKDIEFAYKPQDGKGGLGGEVKFGYNFDDKKSR
jgi:type VI secretion system secreted protein Hcp